MDAQRLLQRARARCATHRGRGGFCRACYLAELELALIEEHPELGRDEIQVLIAEWLVRADGPAQ
jgi:hypothetical protein